MKDWLVKRLTPKKARQERWVGLATSRQKVWETFFDPALLRLENLRSFYKAEDEDLALLLREMGDYFASDAPNQADRPISVAWRRLELEYKDLELILTSVFRRHYGNLPVTWFPLFAPLDEEYGMTFVPAEGPWPELKNIPPEGLWLTSRGMLGVDFGHLLKIGLRKQEFLERAVPLLKRTKPLHIVYDGPLWYIRFDIPAEFDVSVFWERDEWCALPFRTVMPRFDFVPADARHLDLLSGMFCEWEREDTQTMPFLGNRQQRAWHPDWYVPEGFPPDWLPLDYVIPGVEGESAAPFRLYMTDETDQITVSVIPASLTTRGEVRRRFRLLCGPADVAMRGEITGTPVVISFLPEELWHLDARFSFSSPEGWLPLDWLFPGQEGKRIPRFANYLGEIGVFPALSADMRLTTAVEQDNASPAVPFKAAAAGRVERVNLLSLVHARGRAVVSGRKRAAHSPVPVRVPCCTVSGKHRETCAAALFNVEALVRNESLIPLSVPYAGHRDRLDTHPQFDWVPADFCPLDMPVGGAYA